MTSINKLVISNWSKTNEAIWNAIIANIDTVYKPARKIFEKELNSLYEENAQIKWKKNKSWPEKLRLL